MATIITGLLHLSIVVAAFGAFVGVGVLMSWSHSGEGWN